VEGRGVGGVGHGDAEDLADGGAGAGGDSVRTLVTGAVAPGAVPRP
jgi:hypothetical protein